YAEEVVAGRIEDRTLTPLLKMGLRYLGVKPEYMEDLESRNFGAILEWRP
ncbi:MAG: GNAT family N-acetyltransferase, partial [Chloroflexota bacterium]